TIMHDVLVICAASDFDEGSPPDAKSLHPGYLRAGMTVMDVTQIPRRSAFLVEAQARGCAIVPPRDLLIEQVRAQVKRLIDLDVPRAKLEQTLDALFEEE